MRTLQQELGDIVLYRLKHFNYNKAATARSLDISSATLYRYIQRFEKQRIEDERKGTLPKGILPIGER